MTEKTNDRMKDFERLNQIRNDLTTKQTRFGSINAFFEETIEIEERLSAFFKDIKLAIAEKESKKRFKLCF